MSAGTGDSGGRRDPARAGLLLWGAWLLGAGVALSSLHGILHSYYAVQLAPAIAGAAALGVRWCGGGLFGAARRGPGCSPPCGPPACC